MRDPRGVVKTQQENVIHQALCSLFFGGGHLSCAVLKMLITEITVAFGHCVSSKLMGLKSTAVILQKAKIVFVCFEENLNIRSNSFHFIL